MFETVMWVLGGWFVVACVCALILGRVLSLCALADAPEDSRTAQGPDRRAERDKRPRVAA
jgi:hypothetical protein